MYYKTLFINYVSEECHKKIEQLHKITYEMYAQIMNNDAGYQGRKNNEINDTSLLPSMPLKTVKDFDELEAC